MTATAVIAAFAGPAVVLGAGRLNRRTIVRALMVMLIVSCIATAVAPNIAILLAARALLGFALGGFWGMSASLALRLVPLEMVPRAMTIVFVGISAATVIAAPLGAFLGEVWGWRATFVAAAGLSVLAMVFQLVTLPDLPATGITGLAPFKSVLSRLPVLAGFGVILLVISGHFAGFTFIRPFLEDVALLDIETISVLLLAFGVAGFLGNVAGGALAARNAAHSVGLASLLIALAAVVLVLSGTERWFAMGAVTLWGFAFGAFPVSMSTWNLRLNSDHAESAGALLTSSFQVAIALGAVMGGLLIDTLGPVAVVTYAAGSALLGGAAMLNMGMKTGRKAE